MKTEVVCPHCGNRRMRLTSEIGSYDVTVRCAQCGHRIGVFSGFSVKENDNEKGND